MMTSVNVFGLKTSDIDEAVAYLNGRKQKRHEG
jgi:hypothetical protein